MPAHLDLFRDHGIIPDQVEPPSGPVRASFGWGTIFGQYAATAIVLSFGVGLGALFAITLPVPLNLAAAPAALALALGIAYAAGHKDYAWVELEGRTIRARHLYTGRIVERSVDDVQDLLTLVYQQRGLATVLAEKMVGRVRGIQIRFRDGKTPLTVCRADPKMAHAKELIEAIVYRLWESGPVDAEVTNFEGAPLIRRIYRC